MMEQMLPLLPQSESEVKTGGGAMGCRPGSRRFGPAAERRQAAPGDRWRAGLGGPAVAVPQGAERIPGATSKIFTGPVSSHAVGLERTEEFLAEVLAFFAAPPAPAATG